MLKTVAEAIGKGLFAGLVGTAAMTLSSTIEMKLRGRGSSDAPSKAAGKVLGVQPRNAEGQKRFANVVHWGYGTAWGASRGVIDATGIDGLAADAAHFGAIWSAELSMLPTLGVAEPPTEWDAKELALDALHHAVYAAATGWAYRRLDGSEGARAPSLPARLLGKR